MALSGKRVRLARPSMGKEELHAVRQVLRDGWLTGGPRVATFERALAQAAGVPHAVAVSSGTAALMLALSALGVGPGQDVLVPDFTFPASAGAVVAAGARPVACDVDPVTFNLRPDDLARALTPNTTAVMPVHLFGYPADMDLITEFARMRRLAVVEDAACALGANWGQRACGTFGHAGCFSFHPRKVVTTAEGGAIVTADEALAEKLRLLRNHGMRRQPTGTRFEIPGHNFRMSDVHAAIGVEQMKRLARLLTGRRNAARAYGEALSGTAGLVLPAEPPSGRHGWQSYVVRLPASVDRATVIDFLGQQAIEAVPGAYALHRTAAYGSLVTMPASSVSAELHEQTLALPFHSDLRLEEVRRVARALRELFGT